MLQTYVCQDYDMFPNFPALQEPPPAEAQNFHNIRFSNVASRRKAKTSALSKVGVSVVSLSKRVG